MPVRRRRRVLRARTQLAALQLGRRAGRTSAVYTAIGQTRAAQGLAEAALEAPQAALDLWRDVHGEDGSEYIATLVLIDSLFI